MNRVAITISSLDGAGVCAWSGAVRCEEGSQSRVTVHVDVHVDGWRPQLVFHQTGYFGHQTRPVFHGRPREFLFGQRVLQEFTRIWPKKETSTFISRPSTLNSQQIIQSSSSKCGRDRLPKLLFSANLSLKQLLLLSKFCARKFEFFKSENSLKRSRISPKKIMKISSGAVFQAISCNQVKVLLFWKISIFQQFWNFPSFQNLKVVAYI